MNHLYEWIFYLKPLPYTGIAFIEVFTPLHINTQMLLNMRVKVHSVAILPEYNKFQAIEGIPHDPGLKSLVSVEAPSQCLCSVIMVSLI